MSRFRLITSAALPVPWILSALFVLWLLGVPQGLAAEREVAEATRAAQSRFVHRIRLLDEKGESLTAESTAPYSPRQTCSSSKCHNYEEIAKGTHTRMFPDARRDPRRPPAHIWTAFEAAAGEALPLSCGYLAPKDGEFNPKAQLAVFEFARRFGAFHPGGGPLELDSEGKRYDTRMAEDPKLSSTANRDYAGARWDQSGVLEKDCMVCHALSPYDHAERGIAIDKKAFKWAPAVGMGFVTAPGGKYRPTLFDADGAVHLEIGRPPDRNCLACHRRPAAGPTTWRDGLEADVHSLSGLACVDCHASGLDHVLAGDRTAWARPGYDSLTCKGCHASGRLGSPIPQHKGLPRLHLDRISCEACHSGPRPRAVPLAIEQPISPKWGGIQPGTRGQPSGPTVFAPVLARDAEGKLQAFTRLLPAFYAQKTPKGLEPLDPRSLGYVFGRHASKLQDDDGDKLPEVNTDAEIVAILKALKSSRCDPVYLVGGRAYSLDDKGQLASEPNPLTDPIDQPLAHNVRPAAQALGAEGCTECHSARSPFFLSLGITRALGADGKPEGEPLAARLGRTSCDQSLAALREGYIKPFGPWVLLLTVLVMALHYVLFGPHRVRPQEPEEDVQRFSGLERLGHLGLLGCFLALAATGLAMAAGVEAWLGAELKPLHEVFSWTLVAAALLVFLLWCRDMLFARYDWAWMKVLGGYLGYQGHVPAGRFNAGQKILFWLVWLLMACLAGSGWVMLFRRPEGLLPLAYTCHDLCAYLMILCILGHIYLGSLANPGTLRSAFEGKVTRAWLKHHHPNFEPKEKKG